MAERGSERVLNKRQRWIFGESREADSARLEASCISAEGTFLVADDRLLVSFRGEDGIYRLQLSFPQHFVGNGATFRLRVGGWSRLSHVLLAYVHHDTWHHSSMGHLGVDEWIEVSLGQRDLAYGIQNSWSDPGSGAIVAAHLHFDGRPSLAGARVELEYLELFDEVPRDFPLAIGATRTTLLTEFSEPRLSERFRPLPSELSDLVHAHVLLQYKNAAAGARPFMERGLAPLFRQNPWSHDQALPSVLAEANSYRWSWHAHHPAISLLSYARATGDLAAVFAARDFVSAWLDRSYYAIDADQHFAWYDQGAAERVVSFIMLWEWALKLRFDQRFTARLLEAIFRHCQLLSTEMFYCYNQVERYHNHGVYQDIGLLLGALALPELSQGQSWVALAEGRLAAQFEHLALTDGGLRISVENSVGYHQGLLELGEFAERLVALGGRRSSLAEALEGMRRFSQLVEYVDGRVPAFGDANRKMNPASTSRLAPYAAAGLTVLPKAGYAVVKGNHDGRPFMLAMTASSRSATHKHQDNLSFSLFFDGVEWLIDPAFYSYEPTHQIADYLRSAAAHNAVALPGLAYSTAPGKAQLSGRNEGDEFRLYGRHQAYAEAEIEREVQGYFSRLDLRFADRILPHAGGFTHATSLMLQCGDGVIVQRAGRSLRLTHAASDYALLILLPDDRIQIHRGEINNLHVRGLVATGFMQHAAIDTISCELAPARAVSWCILAGR